MQKPDSALNRAIGRLAESKLPDGAPGASPDDLTVTGDLIASTRGLRYWQRWHEENRAAIIEFNARIACEGLPLATYRSF